MDSKLHSLKVSFRRFKTPIYSCTMSHYLPDLFLSFNHAKGAFLETYIITVMVRSAYEPSGPFRHNSSRFP